MFCREQVARVNTIVPQLREAGIHVVGVGNGNALMARDFAEQFDLDFPLYTDPGRSTYKHFGFKHKMGFRLSTFTRAKEALSQGHRQGRTQGAPFQQGGALLIDPQGQIQWLHVDEGPGEHASLQAILDAVDAYLTAP